MIRALKNATIFGYISLVLNLIISMASVPLLLSYLDVELFGIWTLILSIANFLTLTNFGIPTAASVFISSTNQLKSKKAILRRSITLLTFLTSIILIGFILFCNFADWNNIFGKISINQIETAKYTTLILGCTFLIKTLLSLASSAFQGFGRPDLVKLYEILSSLANFIALFFVVLLKGNLISLALSTSIATILVSIFCCIHYFIYAASIKSVEEKPIKIINISYSDIFTKSIYYFQVGIASMLIWNTDLFFISHLLGVSSIPEFALSQKLFALGLSILTLVTGLLVPFYTKLISEKNWILLNEIYSLQIFALQAGAGVLCVVLILLTKPFLLLWTGRSDLYNGPFLIFSFGLYGFILSRVHVYSGLMTALNESRLMAFVSWGEAFVNLILTYFLILFIGLPGAIIGTLCASFIFPYLILPGYIYKISKHKIKVPPENFILIFITSIFCIFSLLLSYNLRGQTSLLLAAIILIPLYILFIIYTCERKKLRQAIKIYYFIKAKL